MLNPSDSGTPQAIKSLVETAKINDRPIVLWLGAGASSWYGYPRWQEMARQFHGKFKHQNGYVKRTGSQLIQSERLPEFFGYCKSVNFELYQQELVETFQARHSEPVYSYFIRALKWFDNLKIVTTNVDEALEHNLAVTNTIQRSDLSRVPGLINADQPFLVKLHGSVSAFDTAVFTSDDYTELVGNQQYLDILQDIFQKSHVLFFGYGLGDAYLLNLLSDHKIVPTGPHYVVLPNRKEGLPANIKQIVYLNEMHSDHRAAIRTLQELKYSSPVISLKREREHVEPVRQLKSAHYISDFQPPGTFESSQTFTFSDLEGSTCGLAHVGHGLIDQEMQNQVSTAMHDLAVGLICFDEIYLPIRSFDKLFQFLGEDICFELMGAGVFKFVYWESYDAVVYGVDESTRFGCLMAIQKPNIESAEQYIRASVHPVAGQEEAAQNRIESLLASTESISREDTDWITSLTSSLMLYPSIRAVLGLNESICQSTIPSWLIFPVLRLAHLVRVGVISNSLNIGSTKSWFAHPDLAEPTYSSFRGDYWVDDMARFVLTGRFDTDLGGLMLNDRSLIRNLLRFRESASGTAFRATILETLQVNEGASFQTAVNAALRECIPLNVLQNANNQLEGLLRPNNINLPVSALWNNREDTSLILWKQRSKALLDQHCQTHGILENDKCPCGSGVSLRNCCLRSLRINR